MILYKTVKEEAIAEQVIDKSRFITYVCPVETKEEADEFIKKIKTEHKSATHNVPAMVIGEKFQIQWASDDGEPQGTSGAPIVQMLVNEGVTNVAVVVTRYFGGIKLGTGGLVRAYTSSAKLGIEAAQVCEVKELTCLEVKMDYTYLQIFQNMAKNQPFEIGEIKYEEKITINFLTEPENVASIREHIAGVTSGTAVVISEKTTTIKV